MYFTKNLGESLLAEHGFKTMLGFSLAVASAYLSDFTVKEK